MVAEQLDLVAAHVAEVLLKIFGAGHTGGWVSEHGVLRCNLAYCLQKSMLPFCPTACNGILTDRPIRCKLSMKFELQQLLI
jgi:hypothetical protein